MGEKEGVTSALTSPRFVVDTSVALKWFLASGEAYVRAARDLREAYRAGRCTLNAPDLLLIELANALTRGHRVERNKVLEALNSIRELDIQFFAFDSQTLVKAVDLASAFEVTVYDTYFWALAMQSGSDLVTADETFMRKVGQHPSIVPLNQLHLTA